LLKKKEERSRDSSRSTSSSSDDSSRSSSPEPSKKETKTATTLKDYFDEKESNSINWHLSQKSETLMFDQAKESDEKNNETFIWRKKNQKVGIDKLEPTQTFLLNKLKQEEAQVKYFFIYLNFFKI